MIIARIVEENMKEGRKSLCCEESDQFIVFDFQSYAT
jgi:hypothetical protein